ncbi:MAG: cytochrome c family protein, partial [Fimbriimonadales bacterium]|nr:cytochrome c family protein [Fimbriimonadales bacterium]
RSPWWTKAGEPQDQPVPFSHKHHYEELGIDCRYCHWQVTESAHAGVPSTQVCMTCHSQVWTNSPLLQPVRDSYNNEKPLVWNKVNNLPEFVYFDHSAHVNKGISCASCHGGIEKMHLTAKSQPFSMQWCLDCHRNPEKHIRPKEEVFNMYYRTPRSEEEMKALLDKHGIPYDPNNIPKNQLELGTLLVKHYNIHKEQLSDCSICHR